MFFFFFFFFNVVPSELEITFTKRVSKASSWGVQTQQRCLSGAHGRGSPLAGCPHVLPLGRLAAPTGRPLVLPDGPPGGQAARRGVQSPGWKESGWPQVSEFAAIAIEAAPADHRGGRRSFRVAATHRNHTRHFTQNFDKCFVMHKGWNFGYFL